MKEILGKSIFEIDFSGLKASVIFWLVATYQVDIKEYDTMVQFRIVTRKMYLRVRSWDLCFLLFTLMI